MLALPPNMAPLPVPQVEQHLVARPVVIEIPRLSNRGVRFLPDAPFFLDEYRPSGLSLWTSLHSYAPVYRISNCRLHFQPRGECPTYGKDLVGRGLGFGGKSNRS